MQGWPNVCKDNTVECIALRDRLHAVTLRVRAFTRAPASVSNDGRYVSFEGGKGGGVWVLDRAINRLGEVDCPPASPTQPCHGGGGSMSGDGRFVVSNDMSGVYLKDRQTHTLTQVDVPPGGGTGNGSSSEGDVSNGGRFVVFSSLSSNLVPGDTNGVGDIFRWDRLTGDIVRVNISASGAQANNAVEDYPTLSISGDGNQVAFDAIASNLVPGDTNAAADVFVRIVS